MLDLVPKWFVEAVLTIVIAVVLVYIISWWVTNFNKDE